MTTKQWLSSGWCPTTDSLAVGKVAARWVGEVEKPGNTGFNNPQFEKWIRAAGWSPPQSWCAYFVRACYLEAFAKSEAHCEAYRKEISPSAVKIWTNIGPLPSPRWLDKYSDPFTGAIAVWQQVGSWQGHCGIVESVSSVGSFVSIEGNTNHNGSRNGVAVLRHGHTIAERSRKSGLRLLGFVGEREIPF